MSKYTCAVYAPVSTYSGYGARSRDFVKALIQSKPDWNIEIISCRWGNTRMGFLKDHNETEIISRVVPSLSKKPDIFFSITVPNEFQPIGKYNIGVTAGIETTICDGGWLEGCNRMDLILTSSNHSKRVFESVKFEKQDNNTKQIVGTLQLEKPVKVLFEGVDTEVYKPVKVKNTDLDLNNIEEDFCFLTVGHWMQGKVGHDRKNIGYTVKSFLETFKNKKKAPSLILKTQQSGTSILDRERILDKIESIRSTVKGDLPNIYLLHGDLTDEEMNRLYNHPKVKVLLSLTKGEGFGRPLLEFTTTGKPVVTTNWSGQTDFLKPEYTNLISGTTEKVDKSASIKNMILEESEWFKPDDGEVGNTLKTVYKKYKKELERSKKQQNFTLKNFTYQHMVDELDNILKDNLPDLPSEVDLNLESLQLPKLKKIK